MTCYYTREYCRKHNKKYRTVNDLAVLVMRQMHVPDNVEITVLYDSSFDTVFEIDKIHKICRNRGFREVFPIDLNRDLASGRIFLGYGIAGFGEPNAKRNTVGWTHTWSDDEFHELNLHFENEEHVFFRRRHAQLTMGNLRVQKPTEIILSLRVARQSPNWEPVSS